MIAEIRARFDISDEEALYIKQVTEEKAADPAIRSTVTHTGTTASTWKAPIAGRSTARFRRPTTSAGRYEELSDLKYTDTGGIFDIMAVTVIQHHLSAHPS